MEKAESRARARWRTVDAVPERAARTLLQRLEGEYAIADALLYGSRARDNHQPEQQHRPGPHPQRKEGNRYKVVLVISAGVGFDVMLETEVLAHALPLVGTANSNYAERFENNPALIANIKREGLRL